MTAVKCRRSTRTINMGKSLNLPELLSLKKKKSLELKKITILIHPCIDSLLIVSTYNNMYGIMFIPGKICMITIITTDPKSNKHTFK